MARGRKLFTPGQSNSIRPTTDRAREALFSIIGARVVSAHVLDLFAGTGALGLEALSRGANRVIFVDYFHKSLELIKKNYALCATSLAADQKNTAIILKHDLRRGLKLKFPKDDEKNQFDFIFLDPPYGQDLAKRCLEDIDCSEFLTSTSMVIAEELCSEDLPDSFSRLVLSDQRQYGDTGFWFYTMADHTKDPKLY